MSKQTDQESSLYDVLVALIELKSRYENLLNQYDGGKRRALEALVELNLVEENSRKDLLNYEKLLEQTKKAKLTQQMLDSQAKLVEKKKAAKKVNRKKVKLIPVDYQRCQTLVPSGNTFITFGGTTGLVPCENAARYVATERVPGPEGLRGAMSVCERCKAYLIGIKGADYATFVKIEDKKGRRK